MAGFADATGNYLPLVCTLNAARVLDATARMLGVDHEKLSDLALSAPAGCDGLVMVPYFEGERTPNRPDATAALELLNSRIQGSDELMAMVMSCASAWMEAALAEPDGGQSWVI